ncbi:hypothetical protein GYMLUDRAFT_65002 [Collybiopsis luxurians FD-317 M1]|uniref:Autophagy-related protein 13 n=1 Tax=Collybiopsis luxurians FD-317 M1 TaxID=944289 RepID=A0A0D0C8N3_9AGAR|nr:hypothetical protein GYMLUDRAFT_65002 [Collybiopsis luxurians FD-317 M1]
MPSDALQTRITFHLYTKLFYVINEARSTDAVDRNKVDKWFNLETPHSDSWTREGQDPYRSISDSWSPPRLEIQVLLTVPDTLPSNHRLVYTASGTSRVPVDTKYKYIVLESWDLDFRIASSPSSSLSSDSQGPGGGTALPTVYKQGIPFFRSVYSLLRLLPAWKLSTQLKSRGDGNGGLGIRVRAKADPGSGVDESAVLSFRSSFDLPTSSHTFAPIHHPLGALTVTCTYLSSPAFVIDGLESLPSSRFRSLDSNTRQDPTFNSSNPGMTLPRSLRGTPHRTKPPSHTVTRTSSDVDSIAERFIIPAPSSRAGQPVLPITRATTTTATSTQPLFGLADRLRRESLGAAASDSRPTTKTITSHPQPLPLRHSSSRSSTTSSSSGPPVTSTLPTTSQPSTVASRKPSLNPVNPVNPVNPFKTNTLASATPSTSSSSRASSAFPPSSLISSSPSHNGGPSSSNTSNPNTALTSLSSLSNLINLPRPPSGLPTSIRPPSFTPSSLGAASTSTGTGTGTSASSRSASAGGPTTTTANTNSNPSGVAVPTSQKRYSSSFGHRYSSPARGGSVGSHTSTGGVRTGGSSGGGSIDGVEGGRFVGGSRGRPGFGSAGGERESRRVSLVAPSNEPDIVGTLDTFEYTPLQADHDALSHFMRDIASRKPLLRRPRIHSQDSSSRNELESALDTDTESESDVDNAEEDRQRMIQAPRIFRDESRVRSGPSARSPSRGMGLGLEGVPPPSSSLLPTILGGIGPPRNGDNGSGRAAPPLLDSHSSSSSSRLSLAAQPARVTGLGLEGVPPPPSSLLPVTSGGIDIGRGTGDSESEFAARPLSNGYPPSSSAPLPHAAPPPSSNLPSSRRASSGRSPPSTSLQNAIPLPVEDDAVDTTSDNPEPTNTSAGMIITTITSVPTYPTPSASLPPPPPFVTHSSPMLTSASDIDAKLKKMNEVFLTSLEGLGRGRAGRASGGKDVRTVKGREGEREVG